LFEYVYDSADRLFHLAENGPSTTLGSLFYDVLGQRERLDRDVSGAVTGYAHDLLARLTGLAHDLDGMTTANDAAFGFAYNPASQVITRTLANASYEFPLTPAVTSYVVNGRNQYTQVGGANQGFDANGNLTSDGATTYGYDTENRLMGLPGVS
jgi:hypothetical protein